MKIYITKEDSKDAVDAALKLCSELILAGNKVNVEFRECLKLHPLDKDLADYLQAKVEPIEYDNDRVKLHVDGSELIAIIDKSKNRGNDRLAN